jgi:hypothetical protein
LEFRERKAEIKDAYYGSRTKREKHHRECDLWDNLKYSRDEFCEQHGEAINYNFFSKNRSNSEHLKPIDSSGVCVLKPSSHVASSPRFIDTKENTFFFSPVDTLGGPRVDHNQSMTAD